MKRVLLTCAAASLLAAPGLSLAQEASPIAANISLVSKYKFRGQDQSDPAKAVLPALQGGFDFARGGLYLGNWNSSVGFAGGTEMDFYGGFKGEAGAIAYDVGLLHYYYPGSTSAFNTTEIYGSVGFGPVSAKYSRTVSSKWFGIDDGQGTGYFELNAKFELVKGVNLIAKLGTTQFSSGAKRAGVVNYSDYKFGAGWDLGHGFGAEAAYVGATKRAAWEAAAGGDLNKARIVFSISKAM